MRDGRKRSVLNRYIIFGVLAVMIPCFLLISIWTRERGLENERQLMDAEKLLLVRMMEKIESGVDDLKKVSEQLMTDKEISPYRLRKSDYYTVEAFNKLEQYCDGTEFFEDLMICLDAEDEIYRSDGKETFATLSQNSFVLSGTLTPERLFELLDAKAAFGYLHTDEHLFSKKVRKNLITYPLKSASGETYGTLVGLMSEDYFHKILYESEVERDIVICNGAGQILFATGSETQIQPEFGEMLQNYQAEQCFYNIKQEGEKYQAIVYRSDTTNWFYVSIVSQKTLNIRGMQAVMSFSILLFLLCALLAGVIGVLIAFYCYLPVRSLLHLFNPRISYNAKRDELSLINHYIMNLQKESNAMKQRIKDGEVQRIREVLTEILYGGGTAWETDRESLEKYGFHEHNCEFCIVLLMSREKEDGLELLLKQMMSEELFFITREIGGGYVCLYSAPKGTQEVTDQILRLCERFEQNGYSLRTSIGHYTDDFSGLRDSLNECLLAAELDAESPVASLDSSYKSNVQEFWRPGRAELLLELAVRNGDKEDILRKSIALEDELSNVLRYYRSNEIRYVFHRIMNYFVVLSRDTGMKAEVIEQLIIMRDCKEVAEFFASFRLCVEVQLEENNGFSGGIKGEQTHKIKEFVDANYKSPEMSLSYVAEQFGIRDSYLSKLFKANMGENFIDYLLRMRLEEAARLLRETDMTVKQVVKSVGYEDATSFAKKFSRKFGMTPGMYGKTQRQSKEML